MLLCLGFKLDVEPGMRGSRFIDLCFCHLRAAERQLGSLGVLFCPCVLLQKEMSRRDTVSGWSHISVFC